MGCFGKADYFYDISRDGFAYGEADQHLLQCTAFVKQSVVTNFAKLGIKNVSTSFVFAVCADIVFSLHRSFSILRLPFIPMHKTNPCVNL